MEKTQSISEDKLELINWITNLNNTGILENIKFIKNNYTNEDWYNLLSDFEKNEIEIGLNDIKNKNFISDKTIREFNEKWL